MAEAMPEWQADREAGLGLLTGERPAEALEHFSRALASGARDAALLNGTGAAFTLLGNDERAIRCYQEALTIDSAYAPAIRNLVTALRRNEGVAAVAQRLREIQRRGIISSPIRAATAQAARDSGSQAAAILELESLVHDDPAYAPAWASLAWFLVEAGEMDRARAILHEAYALHPRNVGLLRILAEIEASHLTAHSLAHLERTVENDDGDATERLEAHMALARRALREEDYHAAWKHFSLSNALRRPLEEYDEDATLSSMVEIERVFDRAFFTGTIEANLTDWPIFIFGMPRSGTSLVEQILGAHPQVYPAGELSLLDDIVADEVRTTGSISSAIGFRYGEALNNLAPPLASHVTDKMPANFRFAGLIARYLPRAKMLHLVRDAVDTCVSCFTTNFSDGLAWTLNVHELARYYLAYERLMRHWNDVLPPGRMLEVRYEELVMHPEPQIRRILDFIGLPWNEACLRFNESKGVVRTASATQVRKPMYASSIGIADRYGDAIAPLRKALGR